MSKLSVTTNIDYRDFSDQIVQMIEAQYNGNISLNKNDMDNNVITFELSEVEGNRDEIIDIITKLIINLYENPLISKIINMDYCFYDAVDKYTIFKKAVDKVKSDEERIGLIRHKLADFLSNSSNITIEGFVSFRLKEYQDYLSQITESAVDAFLIEKEYKEFIKLLKYFISLQEPKEELVHIIYYKTGYKIFTLDGKDITEDCRDDFRKTEDMEPASNDDILISTLISIAPRRIYLHKTDLARNAELINTIKSVFDKRVIICQGCDKCR